MSCSDFSLEPEPGSVEDRPTLEGTRCFCACQSEEKQLRVIRVSYI